MPGSRRGLLCPLSLFDFIARALRRAGEPRLSAGPFVFERFGCLKPARHHGQEIEQESCSVGRVVAFLPSTEPGVIGSERGEDADTRSRLTILGAGRQRPRVNRPHPDETQGHPRPVRRPALLRAPPLLPRREEQPGVEAVRRPGDRLARRLAAADRLHAAVRHGIYADVARPARS